MNSTHSLLGSPSASVSQSPFKWEDFLTFAEGLGSGSSECEVRVAIGRAYYATFHFARDFLAARVEGAYPEMKHEDVHITLAKFKTNHANNLANTFKFLKERRVDADYYLIPRKQLNPVDFAKMCRQFIRDIPKMSIPNKFKKPVELSAD